MVKRYLIYGMIGIVLEIFWTGLGALLSGNWQMPGFTYLWMFPIYGLGAFMERLHHRIAFWPWYLRGTFWMLIIFSLEYLSGWTLRALLGACAWDYSASSYSVDGLIRLDYAPVWFALGLIFERVHFYLDRIRV